MQLRDSMKKIDWMWWAGVLIVCCSILLTFMTMLFIGSPFMLIPLFGGVMSMPIGFIVCMVSEEKQMKNRVVE